LSAETGLDPGRVASTGPFDYAAALKACAAGDRAALRRLYERDAAQLLGMAQRIVRRRDLAHDVLHDAFVQIWTRARTFDPRRGSGRAWIFAIVRHRALNLVRDARFETGFDPAALESLADPLPAAPDLLGRMADQEALRRCLGELDERRRTCLLLAYLEGLSHVQIAERLQAPLGTVKAWIRRGLLALRDCLA
jgi:RNA polymerase sigma-70 factor (ECF subfamily)